MTERPPIRIMTRLLAELQTSIISRSLQLTDGDLDRFAILALIVRQTSAVNEGQGQGRRLSVNSLANSLSKPYETVRRHVSGLVATGLCDRDDQGVRQTWDAAGRAALNEALTHSHDAVIRFIDDLNMLGVTMPAARRGIAYRPEAGMAASVDIMLSVLDGNRQSHPQWSQLVIFSAILAINVHGFARDRETALAYPDETSPVPRHLMRAATIAQVARLFSLPESTVRRNIGIMSDDGRIIRVAGGWMISECWLNQPECLSVSRGSFASMKRVFERLATAGFPFQAPSSVYLNGRPPDATER